MDVVAVQVIRTANAEVGYGLQNPLYQMWQNLPGRPNKGQVAMKQFHAIMRDLLQEVRLPALRLQPCQALQGLF